MGQSDSGGGTHVNIADELIPYPQSFYSITQFFFLPLPSLDMSSCIESAVDLSTHNPDALYRGLKQVDVHWIGDSLDVTPFRIVIES